MATEPQAADFFVTRTSGRFLDRLFARIIRWFTATRASDGTFHNSPVNHAGILSGLDTIIEAGRRVRYGKTAQYPEATWSTGRLPAHLTPTDEQRTVIVKAAHDMVGLGYNVPDLFAIALAQDRMDDAVTSNTWWARRLDRSDRVICSELVVRAYRAAGIDLAPGKLAALVSPEDLYALLLPEA